jgi:hypothetical protein
MLVGGIFYLTPKSVETIITTVIWAISVIPLAFSIFGEEFTLAGVGAILLGLGSAFSGYAALVTARKVKGADNGQSNTTRKPKPNTRG